MHRCFRGIVEILQNPTIATQNSALLNELKEWRSNETQQPVLVQQNVQPVQSVQTLPSGRQVTIGMPNDIHDHVEVEESLNIMDKEKELIIKALKKHRGKRKDASSDLGISERTLYRKLKEYDVEG